MGYDMRRACASYTYYYVLCKGPHPYTAKCCDNVETVNLRHRCTPLPHVDPTVKKHKTVNHTACKSSKKRSRS